jgi:hypothetical protein
MSRLRGRPYSRAAVGTLLGTLVAYAFVSVWTGWQAGARDWSSLVRPCMAVRGVVLVMLPLAGGFARGMVGNPQSSRAYAGWLRSTPWRPGRPMPLGPLVLSWEDALTVVALATLAAVDARLPWFTPVLPYLCGRAVVSGASALQAGRFWAATGVALVLPTPLWAYRSDGVLMAALAALVAADAVAIFSALGAQPWEPVDPKLPPRRWPADAITWPTNALGPVPLPEPVPIVRSLCLALLAGWWAWSILNAMTLLNVWGPEPADAYTGLEVIAGFLALCRVGVYCLRCHPPIGLLGRVATGRWVVPGYDRALVAPAVAMAAAVAVPRAVHAAGGSPAVALGAMLVPVVGVLLIGGPTLRNWRLTGHYRAFHGVRPTAQVNQRRRGDMSTLAAAVSR